MSVKPTQLALLLHLLLVQQVPLEQLLLQLALLELLQLELLAVRRLQQVLVYFGLPYKYVLGIRISSVSLLDSIVNL